MNDNHRRNVLRTCRYIDDLLTEMEDFLARGGTQTTYYDYQGDVDGSVRSDLINKIPPIRRAMIAFLDGQRINIERQTLSTFRQVQTRIMFAEMGLHELTPRTLTGYGPLSENVASDLKEITTKMEALFGELFKIINKKPQ